MEDSDIMSKLYMFRGNLDQADKTDGLVASERVQALNSPLPMLIFTNNH